MSKREQLDWEKKWARPAAASAFASVLFLIASTALRQIVLKGTADDERKFMIAIDDNVGGFLASSALQILSFIALSGVFYYLARATFARKPDLPTPLIWIGVVGPPLLAIAGVVSDLHRIDIAEQFLASGVQTIARAEDLLDDRNVLATSVGTAGTLALAISFVFFSFNAMRVGLLTRFMGIIGVIAGALYVIPLLAGPVLQLFWLLAIGVLFLGYWPGGRGQAWETGEEIEWSTRGHVPDEDDVTEPELPPPDGDGATSGR